MKYSYSFLFFNEGIFTSKPEEVISANEVGNRVYDSLLRLVKFFDIKKQGETFIVYEIKLDENPGLYNVYVSPNELRLEYYKNNTLAFKHFISCSEVVRKNILNLLKTYYIGL